MAIGNDGQLHLNSAPFWSHQTILDGRPIGVLAREFVRHHLAAHRLFHLVDIVSLVAVKLTGSDALGHHSNVLSLSLSQTDGVVLLRIEDPALAAGADETSLAAVDESVGTGVFGLLTLQWGIRRIADEAKGLWATFDAHRHKQHVVATVEDNTTFTEGPDPRALGQEGP